MRRMVRPWAPMCLARVAMPRALSCSACCLGEAGGVGFGDGLEVAASGCVACVPDFRSDVVVCGFAAWGCGEEQDVACEPVCVACAVGVGCCDLSCVSEPVHPSFEFDEESVGGVDGCDVERQGLGAVSCGDFGVPVGGGDAGFLGFLEVVEDVSDFPQSVGELLLFVAWDEPVFSHCVLRCGGVRGRGRVGSVLVRPCGVWPSMRRVRGAMGVPHSRQGCPMSIPMRPPGPGSVARSSARCGSRLSGGRPGMDRA